MPYTPLYLFDENKEPISNSQFTRGITATTFNGTSYDVQHLSDDNFFGTADLAMIPK